MNLLLDTHVYLWWRAEPSRISPRVRELIGATPLVFVSVVSAWEVAIKASLGKLRYPGGFSASVAQSGMSRLLLSFEQAEACAQLPLHHKDPFDRALVVQAKTERLALVTADEQLAAYDVDVVWANR